MTPTPTLCPLKNKTLSHIYHHKLVWDQLLLLRIMFVRFVQVAALTVNIFISNILDLQREINLLLLLREQYIFLWQDHKLLFLNEPEVPLSD